MTGRWLNESLGETNIIAQGRGHSPTISTRHFLTIFLAMSQQISHNGLCTAPTTVGLSQKGRTIHPTLLKAFKPPTLLREEAILREEAPHDQTKDSQRDLNKKEGHDVDVYQQH